MPITTKKIATRKQIIAATLVALGAAGLGSAAASQLAVKSGRDVVSGVATQASGCDDSVDLTYNVDSQKINADGSLPIASITVASIDGCTGRTATVYVLDQDGKQIASGSSVVNASSLSVPLSTGAATSFNVAKLAVAIV